MSKQEGDSVNAIDNDTKLDKELINFTSLAKKNWSNQFNVKGPIRFQPVFITLAEREKWEKDESKTIEELVQEIEGLKELLPATLQIQWNPRKSGLQKKDVIEMVRHIRDVIYQRFACT